MRRGAELALQDVVQECGRRVLIVEEVRDAGFDELRRHRAIALRGGLQHGAVERVVEGVTGAVEALERITRVAFGIAR